MRVGDILRRKPKMELQTLPPSALVAEAAEIMSANRIGTVIVSKDGKTLAGILSERDIVREIGKTGGMCLQRQVSDLMTPNVRTTDPEQGVEDVLATMTAGRFRHMPVIEDGALIGLISIGDVVSAQIDELAREKDALTSMIMGHA
ncbi:MAG: CBS domain-containing protein [Shimia sp.]